MNTERRRLTSDIARRLTIDTEPWLSCDDCFHLIDQYVELVLAGDASWPAMRAHLTGCAACGDEARSLLLLAAADEGMDPEAALRGLADSVAMAHDVGEPRRQVESTRSRVHQALRVFRVAIRRTR